ncbi:MAG TPA: hypothetical protein VHQ86_04865 [Candidatus Saccharimonadia bacterium]|nr:hypothetical protein [Candidatus Saccharimonadia bacterium]
MTIRSHLQQERRLEEILFSNADPVNKSKQITQLGFDPEIADEIVLKHQTGVDAPVYYERLDFAELDDLDDSDDAEN